MTKLFEESSAVTVMLKGVPATGAEVAEVTEKCVATGCGGVLAPQPARTHKPQIEMRNSMDFFITSPGSRMAMRGHDSCPLAGVTSILMGECCCADYFC
jgi:hypothetical protein